MWGVLLTLYTRESITAVIQPIAATDFAETEVIQSAQILVSTRPFLHNLTYSPQITFSTQHCVVFC